MAKSFDQFWLETQVLCHVDSLAHGTSLPKKQFVRFDNVLLKVHLMSPAVTTVVKVLESLPESTQEQAAEHLMEWLKDVRDEKRWSEAFQRTEPQLVAAARQARQQIATGQSEPLDLDRL
jgi:hypothetical protein